MFSKDAWNEDQKMKTQLTTNTNTDALPLYRQNGDEEELERPPTYRVTKEGSSENAGIEEKGHTRLFNPQPNDERLSENPGGQDLSENEPRIQDIRNGFTSDEIAKASWGSRVYDRTSLNTRYEIICEIISFYKWFTTWHRSRFPECANRVCCHVGMFVRYIYSEFDVILTGSDIVGSCRYLDALFASLDCANPDPKVLRFKQQLDDDWQTMPASKKARQAKKWMYQLREGGGRRGNPKVVCPGQFDPWGAESSSEKTCTFLQAHVQSKWKHVSGPDVDAMNVHEIVAQIYLSGKICQHYNDAFCKYIYTYQKETLLTYGEICDTRRKLQFIFDDDPQAQESNTLFKQGLVALWAKTPEAEKRQWESCWKGSASGEGDMTKKA